MPFYLVTQTILVEAEDEIKAAENAFVLNSSRAEMPFDVNSGDDQTKRVVLSAEKRALLFSSPHITPSASTAGLSKAMNCDDGPSSLFRPRHVTALSCFVVAVAGIAYAAGWAMHL